MPTSVSLAHWLKRELSGSITTRFRCLIYYGSIPWQLVVCMKDGVIQYHHGGTKGGGIRLKTVRDLTDSKLEAIIPI